MKFHQDYCEEQMSKTNDVNRWKMKLKMLELWCKKILNGKKAKENEKKALKSLKRKWRPNSTLVKKRIMVIATKEESEEEKKLKEKRLRRKRVL